jgi:hypothetical protein
MSTLNDGDLVALATKPEAVKYRDVEGRHDDLEDSKQR